MPETEYMEKPKNYITIWILVKKSPVSAETQKQNALETAYQAEI